jgi:GAF domain-containing protein
MLARNHKLAVGTEGIVGYVVSTGQPRIALDVGADVVHFDNPDLPETRSEIALPLQAGGQTFGALDVQSTQGAAFTDDDIAILSMLADQVAIAIENARLLAQAQAAQREAEETQRHYLRQEWERLMPTLPSTSHEYHMSGVPPVGNAALPEIEQAARQSDVVTMTSQAAARSALAVPIKLRDQVIGVIDLHETDAEREWTADDVALVMAVADQAALALENAHLLEQTQQRARREQLVTQIATKVRAAADVDGIMRAGVQEIRRVLGASHGIVHLRTESQLPIKDKQEAD